MLIGFLSWLLYWVIFPCVLLWSAFSFALFMPPFNLLLSFSHQQGQRVATCLFITCRRSLGMQSSCKCFCLSATSSRPKSLWTERPIRANVSVSEKSEGQQKQCTGAPWIYHTGKVMGAWVWCEKADALIAYKNRSNPPWILHTATEPLSLDTSPHLTLATQSVSISPSLRFPESLTEAQNHFPRQPQNL